MLLGFASLDNFIVITPILIIIIFLKKNNTSAVFMLTALQHINGIQIYFNVFFGV